MTAQGIQKRTQKKVLTATRSFGLCYMCLFLIIIFFKNASAASAWVSEGLKICAFRLIPSLFPFMVLSSMALSCKIGRLIPKCINKFFGKLFGVGSDGTCAVILGWLCGFPIGAKCASELLEDCKISNREYKKLICISSTPSPAFLIGAVGKGMLGSAKAGLYLYVMSLLASAIAGIIFARIIKTTPCIQAKKSTSDKVSVSQMFTKAVSQSALGMLNICAFVVFFCAFLGVLENLLYHIGLSNSLTAGVFGIFELTTALSRICSLPKGIALPLCAAAIGWSGLSVHFQAFSVCSNHELGVPQYMAFHILRAVICFITSLFFKSFL